jgi:hypothetical protein
MKRTIILIAILCAFLTSHAQIKPIQAEEKPYELIGTSVLYWKKESRYEYIVRSSNRYDRTMVHFQLGKTLEQAVESLENLEAAYKKPNTQFKLDGRTCIVEDEDWIRIQKAGDIQYMAGNYMIFRYTLVNDMVKIYELVEKQKTNE